jgi:inosose dehydratase
MKVGYMTNAWGSVVGYPAGVTSVKDAFYLSTGDTDKAVEEIAKAGYEMLEIFDGNLMKYAEDKEAFKKLLNKNNLKLLAVYTGANFIYEEILDDELYKINKAASLASEFGAKHLVLGGGAIRSNAIQENDYAKLAEGLEKAAYIAEKYNLTPSYHPHLGTIVQAPEQLDKLMSLTKINLCPDTGHIEAGGGDSVKIIDKYKERIKYVHLKDFGPEGFLPLGEGQIKFDIIIKILMDNGFKGEFTVEADGCAGPPEEAAAKSYRYLKGILG